MRPPNHHQIWDQTWVSVGNYESRSGNNHLAIWKLRTAGLRCTGRRGGCGGVGAAASTDCPCGHWRLHRGARAKRTAFSAQIRKGTGGAGAEGERTGGVDDENEVAAPAVGGGDAVGGETAGAGAGLGGGVRGGTREDQRRPRCRRGEHGAACRLSPAFGFGEGNRNTLPRDVEGAAGCPSTFLDLFCWSRVPVVSYWSHHSPLQLSAQMIRNPAGFHQFFDVFIRKILSHEFELQQCIGRISEHERQTGFLFTSLTLHCLNMNRGMADWLMCMARQHDR
jgi:hypothetical protein